MSAGAMLDVSGFDPARLRRLAAAVALGGAVFFAACSPAPAPPRNVILISIDDVRPDRLGSHGGNLAVSPVLDVFAERGVRFDQAFTAAPWTLPSHMSMLTSLYPSEHGVNPAGKVEDPKDEFPTLDEAVPTLQETMRAHGFATAAFTDGVWLGANFGFSRGFDLYFENDTPGAIPPLRDRLFEWLRGRGQERFFAFIHTFAVHLPFEPSEEALAAVAPGIPASHRRRFGLLDIAWIRKGQTKVTPAVREEILTLYDAGIHEVDGFLGELRAELASLGIEEDTLVIVTSDHGEEFGEHGRFGHALSLYDEVLRVPLVFSGAGLAAPNVVSRPVSTIDIMPTVLDLVGIPLPGHESGQSLRPFLVGEKPAWWERFRAAPERAILSETAKNGGIVAIRQGSHKAIHRKSNDRLEIYDVERDPGETRDLARERPELRKKFAELVRTWLARDTRRAEGSTGVDSQTYEKLKALGYVGN